MNSSRERPIFYQQNGRRGIRLPVNKPHGNYRPEWSFEWNPVTTAFFWLIGLGLLPIWGSLRISILAPLLLVVFFIHRKPFHRQLKDHKKTALTLRPDVSLSDGVLNWFGERKVFVCVEPIAPDKIVDAHDKIMRLLTVYGGTAICVATTGRPSTGSHVQRTTAPYCLVLADAGADPAAERIRLRNCLTAMGLNTCTSPDSTFFDITAGHGVISDHYIVDKLPKHLAVGWLCELNDFPCDFTIVTGYSEIEAGKTYKASVDIVLHTKTVKAMHAARCFLTLQALRHDVRLRSVRMRETPFNSAFTEKPVGAGHYIEHRALQAFCPFFFSAPQIREELVQKYERSPWHALAVWRAKYETPKNYKRPKNFGTVHHD